MDKAFIEEIYRAHRECERCPSKQEVSDFFTRLLGTLFPSFSTISHPSLSSFDQHLLELRKELQELLYTQMKSSAVNADTAVDTFFTSIPGIYSLLLQDVTAICEGDPAATSEEEVIRSYPGFYAIAAYRFAHQLAVSGVDIIPRMITEHAHNVTGIDIHPGATIGRHFCIDHGTGIVIGETTNIGDHVKIYQGVTLGALSVKKEDAKTKRHPTIEDHVVIYSGATILGGNTVIGHHSVIGGNVWITKSVPPETSVHYKTNLVTESNEPDTITQRSLSS